MPTISQDKKSRLIRALVNHANWHRDNCNETCYVSLDDLKNACEVIMNHDIDNSYDYEESVRLRKLIQETNWM